MRRTRNHRPTRKRKIRCYGHNGKKKKKKIQNKEKRNACKGISVDRGGVENLSRRSKPQWIENLSRICQTDKEHKILARSIDLSVEKLSRSNLEISIEEVSVQILSKSYRGCRKEIFHGGKTHKMRKQQDGYLNKHPSNMFSTQTTP